MFECKQKKKKKKNQKKKYKPTLRDIHFFSFLFFTKRKEINQSMDNQEPTYFCPHFLKLFLFSICFFFLTLIKSGALPLMGEMTTIAPPTTAPTTTFHSGPMARLKVSPRGSEWMSGTSKCSRTLLFSLMVICP